MKWEGTKSIFWGVYSEETGLEEKHEIKPGEEMPEALIEAIRKHGPPHMIPHHDPLALDVNNAVDEYFAKEKKKGMH
jgi:hypothetical protein